MKEGLTRVGLAIGVIVGTTVGSGCAESPRKPSPDRPASATMTLVLPRQAETTPILSLEWASLSALERIQSFEKRRYPQIEQFDPIKELALATAQFYCEQTRCKIGPDQMARNISFVPAERFLEHLSEELGKTLTDEEKRYERSTRLEIVTEDNRLFINEDLYREIVAEIPRRQPQVINRLGGNDLNTVLTKSLFIHIFTHMNDADEEVHFEPFSLRHPRERGPINFDHWKGFKIFGKGADGKPKYIVGTNEAVTELVSTILGDRTGIYLSLAPQYVNGVIEIRRINQIVNISGEEFLQYASGERSLQEYLRKIGSLKNRFQPDVKAATLALATIGLGVDGVIRQSEVRSSVEHYLGTRFN